MYVINILNYLFKYFGVETKNEENVISCAHSLNAWHKGTEKIISTMR